MIDLRNGYVGIVKEMSASYPGRPDLSGVFMLEVYYVNFVVVFALN